MERGKATFGIKSWNEAPWHDSRDGRKLTEATVVKTYSGDLEGEGTMHYVMAYASEASAIFVGVSRAGSEAGRARSP